MKYFKVHGHTFQVPQEGDILRCEVMANNCVSVVWDKEDKTTTYPIFTHNAYIFKNDFDQKLKDVTTDK